jgi:hypothetical protein
MKTKRVYLSGRMSGLPLVIWRWGFSIAKDTLERQGYEVINPADTLIARHPWLYRIVGYRLTLWYDLRLLRRCTHIYMVGNDWHLSRGARLERMKARKWNIKLLEL